MNPRLKIVCAALDAKPLFWTEKNGSRYGFEPDVATLVFAEAGLDFDWVFLPWSDFLPSVVDGRMDGVWCGQGIIPERLDVVDFTDPYAIFNESVIMRAGEAVPTHEGLAGKRVGAIANSANMRLAKTFDDAILVAFNGDSDDVFGDMVSALRTGEIDAVVDDDVALIPIAEMSDIDMAFTVATRNPWGMGVRKGRDELRDSVNAAIASIKIDGRLKSIWTKWVPELQYPF